MRFDCTELVPEPQGHPRTGRWPQRRWVRRLCLVIACLGLLACAPTAAAATDPPSGSPPSSRRLEPDLPREGSLAGGQADLWRLDLGSEDGFAIELEQRGQDFKLSVRSPGESEAVDLDLVGTSRGTERFFGVAGQTGPVTVEVQTSQPSATLGAYTLRAEVVSPATSAWEDRAEATRLLARADAAVNSGKAVDLPSAQEALERALLLWRRVGDSVAESRTLRRLAIVEDNRGHKDRAIELTGEALAVAQKAGDEIGEATSLEIRGSTLDEQGREDEALSDLRRSLSLYRKHDDVRGQVVALGDLASAIDKQGDKKQALGLYQQTLELATRIGDRVAQAVQLNNMGRIYSQLGELSTATEDYQNALEIWNETGQHRFAGWALHNLGAIQEKRGEPQAALDDYGRAMKVWDETGDLRGKSFTLHNMGVVNNSLGESQKALDLFEQASDLFRKLGLKRGLAQVQMNLGRVQSDLGNGAKALELFREALGLARQAQWKTGEASALERIGHAYLLRGDLDLAGENLEMSRALFEELGAAANEATALENLGYVALAQGDSDEALAFARKALDLRRATEDRKQEGDSHRLLGAIFLRRGDLPAASDELQTALDLTRAVGDLGGEAKVLYELALVRKAEGKLPEALELGEKALDRVEVLRWKVGSPRLRATFLGDREKYFGFVVDLLMELDHEKPGAGFAEQAFAVSEQSRARSFLDVLAEMREQLYSDVDPELRRREEDLRHRILLAYYRLLKAQAGDSEEEQQKANATLQEDLSDFDQLQGAIRESSPRFAALTRPEVPSAGQIRSKLLDDGTVLLEYFLGADRGWLFALSADGFHAYPLPPRDQIEGPIKELRKLVGDQQHAALARQRIERLAMDLGATLLGPVDHLAQFKRLVIVPEGALHYLPFAMLGRPGRPIYEPLVSRAGLEISVLPSAAVLEEVRQRAAGRARAPRGVALLADPVFSRQDPRVTGSPVHSGPEPSCASCERSLRSFRSLSPFDLTRLPDTRREAEQIAKEVGRRQVFEALGFDANVDLVLGGTLAPYRVLHFATHGLLNDEHPELSSLVLSLVDASGKGRPGFLLPQQILASRFQADLAVLSACDTALGQNIRGEGLVGMARAFIHAGVSGVVASVWRVDDQATTALMARFYQAMAQEHLSAPAALAEAERALLGSRSFSSPIDWAGFVFEGDWRTAPFR